MGAKPNYTDSSPVFQRPYNGLGQWQAFLAQFPGRACERYVLAFYVRLADVFDFRLARRSDPVRFPDLKIIGADRVLFAPIGDLNETISHPAVTLADLSLIDDTKE